MVLAENKGNEMFTADNTTGYTTDQLDALNYALKLKLAGVEPNSDEWHQIEKALFLPFYISNQAI